MQAGELPLLVTLELGIPQVAMPAVMMMMMKEQVRIYHTIKQHLWTYTSLF